MRISSGGEEELLICVALSPIAFHAVEWEKTNKAIMRKKQFKISKESDLV